MRSSPSGGPQVGGSGSGASAPARALSMGGPSLKLATLLGAPMEPAPAVSPRLCPGGRSRPRYLPETPPSHLPSATSGHETRQVTYLQLAWGPTSQRIAWEDAAFWASPVPPPLQATYGASPARRPQNHGYLRAARPRQSRKALRAPANRRKQRAARQNTFAPQPARTPNSEQPHPGAERGRQTPKRQHRLGKQEGMRNNIRDATEAEARDGE